MVTLCLVIFRKKGCFRNREETSTNQPVIGEDGYVEYKKNSEGESYAELGVSSQPVIGEDGYTEYKKNTEE